MKAAAAGLATAALRRRRSGLEARNVITAVVAVLVVCHGHDRQVVTTTYHATTLDNIRQDKGLSWTHLPRFMAISKITMSLTNKIFLGSSNSIIPVIIVITIPLLNIILATAITGIRLVVMIISGKLMLNILEELDEQPDDYGAGDAVAAATV